MTEDRRNSFSRADERLLATLAGPLTVTIHLAPEDPRYVDVQRAVFSKLARVLPDLTIRIAAPHAFAASGADERYGEIEYVYGARRDVSRSTSPREILPLIYGLAGVPPPAAAAGRRLSRAIRWSPTPTATLAWFFAALPLAIVLAWLCGAPAAAHRSRFHQASHPGGEPCDPIGTCRAQRRRSPPRSASRRSSRRPIP